MGKLYTREELFGILETIELGGVVFALSGNSEKRFSAGVQIDYVPAGSKWVEVEKKIPRTFTVSNAEFVKGDITSLPLGTKVEVDGMEGILTTISRKGFTVRETLV